MLCHQIPFIDNEDAGFEMLLDVVDELAIDFADPFGGIKKQ